MLVRKRYSRRPPSLQLEPKHRLSVEISQVVTASGLLISSHPSGALPPSSGLRVRKSHRNFKLFLCRTQLQWLSCMSTGMNLTLLLLTFWIEEANSLAVLTVVVILSLIQTWLVLMYWSRRYQFEKLMRRTTEGKGVVKRSKGLILICAAECAFHLVVPFSSELRVGEVQVNSLATLLIWCRNYHILRLLFWTSELSSLRTHVLADINNVKVKWSFFFKFFAWKRSGVMAVLIIFEVGLLLTVCLDIQGTYLGFTTLVLLGNTSPSNSTWYEQLVLLLTLGLGLYLVGTIVICVRRVTALTEREERLSTALVLGVRAGRVRDRAASLLQAWWRLLLMRRRHRLNLDTVFTWYRTLLTSTCLGAYSSSLRHYSLSIHFASIQHKMHRQIRATCMHFAFDLDLLSTQALLILEKAQAVAGVRRLATLPQRLSTILEDVSEQAQSPVLPHCIRK